MLLIRHGVGGLAAKDTMAAFALRAAKISAGFSVGAVATRFAMQSASTAPDSKHKEPKCRPVVCAWVITVVVIGSNLRYRKRSDRQLTSWPHNARLQCAALAGQGSRR